MVRHAELHASVALARREHRFQLAMKRAVAHVEVDEAGTGDVDLVDEITCRQRVDDRLRDGARVAAHGLRQPHRDIGREVAVTRVARTLDRGADRGDLGRSAEIGQREMACSTSIGDAGFSIGPVDCGQRAAMITHHSEKLNRVDVDGPAYAACPGRRPRASPAGSRAAGAGSRVLGSAAGAERGNARPCAPSARNRAEDAHALERRRPRQRGAPSRENRGRRPSLWPKRGRGRAGKRVATACARAPPARSRRRRDSRRDRSSSQNGWPGKAVWMITSPCRSSPPGAPGHLDEALRQLARRPGNRY